MRVFIYIIAAAAVLCTAAAMIAHFSRVRILDRGGMEDGYSVITQEEAKRIMAENKNCVILDVRRRDEFESGHIPGAICIPNEEILTEPPAALPNKNAVILVYCRSGRRSKEASQKLFDMGYTGIFEFGGIIDWTGETVTGPSEDWLDEYYQAISPRPVLVIKAGGKAFYATDLARYPSSRIITDHSPLVLEMHEECGYGKAADLPFEAVYDAAPVTARPGDILLCGGDKLIIACYEFTGEYTVLASVDPSRAEDLVSTLGEGDVTVKLYAEWGE